VAPVTHGVLATALAFLAANASAADQRWPVICQDGDKHLIRLTETALGTPGVHEVTDINLGSSKPVWLTLPDQASLSDRHNLSRHQI